MRPGKVLYSIVAAAVLALTLLYMTIRPGPVTTAPRPGGPAVGSEAIPVAPADFLDPVQREPAIVEQPVMATDGGPIPVVPAVAVRDPVGTPETWPAEYANKSLDELAADADRLIEEFNKEIEAEVEKRFQDGRYVTYAQGGQPTEMSTFGILRSRGDERSIKYVNLDPRFEPVLFVKQNKANWLRGEITRRKP